MKRIRRLTWIRGALGLAAIAAAPAMAAAQSPAADRPVMRALRAVAPPAVDGEVVGDPAWEGAVSASGFRQTTPDEGEPASERTEVFVVFTDDTLYFGVVCHDRTPEKIIVSDSRRDASLSETDSFQIILDTFSDRQNGFVFGTNPAGIEYDGQVSKEGEDSSGGGFNLSWDATWEVEAKISSIGWSAEIAIPFRTLRYPKRDASAPPGSRAQSWGINFQRNIRRRNETAFWAPLPRQLGLFRLSLAGTLDGVEAPRQRNLKVVPYVLVEGRRSQEGDGVAESSDEDFGLDVKYSVTPSLTLDATYNTDFAQVEADELQINLDRFSLFFPEKRPFFLENAGLFTVGIPGEVELFFSRRIGIGPDGEEIPILGGVRLSGKVGRSNVGFLQMRSEEVAGVAPRNDFTVARYNRELPNRSSVGAILVQRRGGGELAAGDDTNRTFGVDGRWGIGRYGEVSGFLASTDTPGVEADEHAFRLSGRYDSEAWLLSASYTEVADGFNPEVGFLSRGGYRRPELVVFHRYRPENLFGLHELRPHVTYRGFWNFDGFQETGFLHLDNHWEWKSGFEVHTGVNFTREGVTEPFEIAPGVVVPEGTYDHREGQIVLITNQGAPLSFRLRTTVGGFFGGDRVALSPSLRFRVGETFNTELSWTRNDIELPGGDLVTNLGRLRLSYSFTPKIFLEALVQYNDRDDVAATNLRFGWLQAANAGLFVVYNELRDTADTGFGEPDRSLILKYSRIVDLLR